MKRLGWIELELARQSTASAGTSGHTSRPSRAAGAPWSGLVLTQAEGSTVPAHLAFDHRVDVLRDLRKAGWIVLEV
jgi:hypothetical protein